MTRGEYDLVRWLSQGSVLQPWGNGYILRRTRKRKKNKRPSPWFVKNLIDKGWLNPRSLMVTEAGRKAVAEEYEKRVPKWLSEGFARRESNIKPKKGEGQ